MMTPEEKIENDKKIVEQRERRDKYRIMIRAALRNVLSTPDGQAVFRHMATICDQFSHKHVVPTTGGIDIPGSLHNLSRNSVYIDFRQMMTEENKRVVESKGDSE